MNPFDHSPSLPPLGSAFSPEPVPYDWQEIPSAVASAGYPAPLADSESAGPIDDLMDEDADDYDDEASSAMYAETFDSWINPDYIEPEDHAAAEPQAGSVSLSQPEAFALTGVIDDALQTIQSIVAQSNVSYYDNARHVTPPSTRARLSPSRSPPTRSPFAPPVSPPQEGPPVVEHDYSSPHVFPPVPTSQTSEPALPGCRFGFPNLTERSKRGSKRGHGAEIGPRSEGRTPKRPRLARSSQPESGESPLGPVASSPSSSGLATSPRTSVSDRENARKSPARSPLRIWGVAPSVPATSAPRAAEDRASLAAGTNTPPAPAPTTTDRPPLAARTNSPPSSTPASVPVPTIVRSYLELAGYPEHARDLPGEFYDDIRRVGVEFAPRGLAPATWSIASTPPTRQKIKGKGKAAIIAQPKKAKKPQKSKRKPAVAKYFCPFYTPPASQIPGYPHQNLFAVPSPNVPGAAPAPPPHLVSCTRTEPYGRQADALRHVRWMHIKPRTFCILDGAPASALPFNRSDAIKRHLKESDVCMPKGGFDLLVHDLAARLGLRIDDADAPDPKARQVAKRNRGKCEAMVARQWTRIVMPCYQEPAVRATIGVYLRWSRKSLARLEDEMRAQALVVERCACEGCREPRQAWAEEWAKGRVDVPVWFGEWAAGEDLALGGDGVRRRQKKQGEDVDANEDEEDEEEDDHEHEHGHGNGHEEEGEEEDEDEEEERAAPARTRRGMRPQEAFEDDDRLSPEPEEGVEEDEDETETPSAPLPAPVARPEATKSSSDAVREGTLTHTVAQSEPKSAHAAVPRMAQNCSQPTLVNVPSTSPPSGPVAAHTGVRPMESPLEVWRRTYGNASTSLPPAPALVASSSTVSPPPDDSVDWDSVFKLAVPETVGEQSAHSIANPPTPV